MYNEGLRTIIAGVNPMLMKRRDGQGHAADIVAELHKLSIKV